MNCFFRTGFIFCSIAFLFSECRDKDDPTNTLFDFYGFIDHDGVARTFHVHLPESYYQSNERLPLLLALHGGGGSADNFEEQSGLNNKADQSGFILVYPDGAENPGILKLQTWNAGKCCGANAISLDTDDVGFISKLIDELIKTNR
jgi:polyhydroxybutyrate depolymerase